MCDVSKKIFNRVVGILEDNLNDTILALRLNAFNVRVRPRCYDIVFTTGFLVDLPGGTQGLNIDGGTIIKFGLWVHLNSNSYFVAFLANLELLTIVLIKCIRTISSDLIKASRTHGAKYLGGRVAATALTPYIEIWPNSGHRNTELSALFQVGHRMRIDVIQFLGFSPLTGCFNLIFFL